MKQAINSHRKIVLFSAFLALGAYTSQAAAETEVVYEKHQVEVFDDDTIDGSLDRPDGQYLQSQKKQRHRKLIKIRRHYRDEILHSLRVL